MKEWKCEWMVYVLVVKVLGYCIALDLTVLMLFFSTHSIQKCLMHLNEGLAKDSSVTPTLQHQNYRSRFMVSTESLRSMDLLNVLTLKIDQL